MKKWFQLVTIITVIFLSQLAFGFNFADDGGALIRDDPNAAYEFFEFINFPAGASDVTGSVATINFLPTILDDPTDNAQITASQCNGVTIITNDGAGASRTYKTPVPAAGLVCMVYLEEAQDVDIDPSSSYQIYVLTDSTGDKISSDATQGSCIKLIAHDATGWWPYGRVGAWTDAN